MRQSPTPERSSPREESFGFTGLFDFVQLRRVQVGDITFRIPSVESINTWKQRRDRVYLSLTRGEDTGRTNHTESIGNMVWWIERGENHLKEANESLAKRSEAAVHEALTNARSAFANAQSIAQTMNARYALRRMQTNSDF